jgi:hypothetical protein
VGQPFLKFKRDMRARTVTPILEPAF